MRVELEHSLKTALSTCDPPQTETEAGVNPTVVQATAVGLTGVRHHHTVGK